MAVSRQSTHMAVPSGPRATMTATAERPEPQWPEDAVEFHSYFNLLNAIGSFHGSDDQLVNEFCRAEDTDDVTDTELLRRFYDGVAYLCDVKKGGETVTAAALANNVVLYLATNTKLPREVQNFIKWVVMIELRSGNTKSRRDVADSILQAAVERAAHRMEFYSREMKKFWAICSASFENQFRGIQNSLSYHTN